MTRPKNDHTYIIFPAANEADICPMIAARFPGGYNKALTVHGVDYLVLQTGPNCNWEMPSMVTMRGVIDGHTYHADILDVLKVAPAEETAKETASAAAVAAADAAYPEGQDNPGWQQTFDSEYASNYDLAAAVAGTPTPDPGNVNQAQARDFSAEYTEIV